MKDIIVHTSDISKDANYEWEKKNLEVFKSARDLSFLMKILKNFTRNIG